MIYFDNAATTPIDPAVVEIITQSLYQDYGNASSTYGLGRDTRKKIEDARQVFAQSIQARPEDIIITSGGSESNNTAIVATALALREKGQHLITTAVEHHSVLHPMNYLETLGFEVTYLPVDEEGQVTPEQVKAALREDTILVSIIYGNNEVGTINPIAAIGAALAEADVLFHTDAVQAYGSQRIDVEAARIDMLSITGHKINAPKGIGFLYRRSGLHLPNYIHGGAQENDHRAGTENTPYIRGLAKAVEMVQENRDTLNAHKRGLKEHLLAELERLGVEYAVNGQREGGLPHIVSLWLPHLRSDKFLIQCDLKGIELSAGSACTAGSLEPSHVLMAMFGPQSPRAYESVRISFGSQNTQEEVDTLAELIASLQKRARR